jgi:hypothetical protein
MNSPDLHYATLLEASDPDLRDLTWANRPVRDSRLTPIRSSITAELHNRSKDAHPVQDPLIEILIHAFRHFYYSIHA